MRTNHFSKFYIFVSTAILCSCGGENNNITTKQDIEEIEGLIESSSPAGVGGNVEYGDISISGVELVQAPIVDSKTGKYTFAVKAKLEGVKNIIADVKIKYALYVKGDVKPSTNDGCYTIAAFCPDDNSVSAYYQDFAGFVPTESPVAKLTIPELQKLVDELITGSSKACLLSYHKQIATSVSFRFTNLASNESKPMSFISIQEKVIMGDWTGVKVESIEYNEQKKVSCVVMKIIY